MSFPSPDARVSDPDALVASMRVLLDPYLPTPELKKRFEYWLPMLARTVCLGNLPSYDYVFRLKLFLYSIILWLKMGLPDVAERRIAEFLLEVQASRSVQGFERKMEVTQRTITESIEKTPEVRRRGLLARLFGWGGKPEEEGEA